MCARSDIRADFERLITQPEDDLELGRAALVVAAEADPGCDVEAHVRTLDEWGRTLASRLDPGWNNLQKLARLRSFLFEDLRFRGAQRDYYDPKNSLLDQVIERKVGIPLSLSIIFMEVGWRVGIPFQGVGFPGHFLVRLCGEPRDLLLDPYSHGQSIHEEDCVRMLQHLTGGRVEFRPELLVGVSKRRMIARLLLNLKSAYLRIQDDHNALAAVERILLMTPEDTDEIRDHGLLLYRLRQHSGALAELKRYLMLAPEADDRETVERHVSELKHYLSLIN